MATLLGSSFPCYSCLSYCSTYLQVKLPLCFDIKIDRISFNSGLYNQDPLDIVVETMDFCYFLNIILKFFVAIRKPDESLITKHSAIAKSFLM